jgi:hypothetical protein
VRFPVSYMDHAQGTTTISGAATLDLARDVGLAFLQLVQAGIDERWPAVPARSAVPTGDLQARFVRASLAGDYIPIPPTLGEFLFDHDRFGVELTIDVDGERHQRRPMRDARHGDPGETLRITVHPPICGARAAREVAIVGVAAPLPNGPVTAVDLFLADYELPPRTSRGRVKR